MASDFKQIMDPKGNENGDVTSNGSLKEVILLLGGDDIVRCDFKTSDYIIGGDGQDTLYTGGAFEDFTIKEHPLISEMFLVTSTINNKTILVKGVETFNFNEGNASLDNFINGISPKPDFDKIIGLKDFLNNGYHAEDGVSEQFLIDFEAWNRNFTIDGFNADEDQVVIVSDSYSNAKTFVDANPTGLAGTWGCSVSNVVLINSSFNELTLTDITGVTGKETIFDAESSQWLKFGEFELPPEEALSIDMSHFVDSVYNATDATEEITIPLSAWDKALTINNFDADHDKLVINSNGQYTSAAAFIAANPTGVNGTWGYDTEGGAALFNPTFQQISLAGIINAEDGTTLIEAETQGWIKFI